MKQLITTPTLTGQTGSLLTYLDRVLCIGECVVDAGGFVDRSAEARTEGGTPFNLMSATADAVYFGSDDRFSALRFNLATPGAGVVPIWEYWNGSAWTSFVPTTDGTAAFTHSGEVTWSIAALTGWTKNQVNGGPAFYHVRVRSNVNPSVTPTCNFCVVNWTIFDDAAAANSKVYKTVGEDGGTTSVYLFVNSSAITGSSGQSLATDFRLYESWDATLHTGTNATPTAAQLTNLFALLSKTPDATARTVYAFVSRDGFFLWVFDGTTANQAYGYGVVKLTSYVVNDVWSWAIFGFAQSGANGKNPLTHADATGAALEGEYVQRALTGSGGSTQLSKPGVLLVTTTLTNFYAYPNGADGKLIARPVEVSEGGAGGSLRGSIPFLVAIPHTSAASLANGDVFTDPNTGTKYTIVRAKCEQFNGTSFPALAPWYGIETPN